LAVAGLFLVGCGADAEPGGSSDPGDSASGTTSQTAQTSAAPFVLPETCSALLSIEAIDAGLGVRIPGNTQYLVGVAEPDIGRTGRVTCSYGIVPNADGTSAPPLLQASVFTYDTVESAQDRIATVVGQSRDAGDRTQEVPVGGSYAGVVIVSVTDATLVVAVDDRNYSITLAPGVVTDEALTQALAALAESAINAGQPEPSATATAIPTRTS